MARNIVAQSDFTTPPWTGPSEYAGRNPESVFYLDQYGQRRRLERQGTTYDLDANGRAMFTWTGGGQWTFRINATQPLIAISRPIMKLVLRFNRLENCRARDSRSAAHRG